jgi:putative FmdB family regulatory protein
MPTYEYICTECKHNWEEDQNITSEPTAKCPKCGKSTAKRLIAGGTSFQLKGGCWSKDGYKG